MTPQETSKAVEYFENALNLSGALEDANHWGAYAYSLAAVGRKATSDSVFTALKFMGSSGRDSYNYWKSYSCRLNRNFELATSLMDKALVSRDSVSRKMLLQSTTKAQRDYYSIQEFKSEKTIMKQKLFSVIIILAFLTIIGVGYFLFRLRRRVLEREKDEIIAAAETVKEELAISKLHSSEAYDSLKTEYASLFRESFGKLGETLEVYLSEDSYLHPGDFHNAIYKKVKKLISEIGGDSKNYAKLEKIINERFGNLMSDFRKDFPGLNEDDYRFVVCEIVGFDSKTLSVLFKSKTLGAVYSRKYRLKNMIQASNSSRKEDYLSLIS